MSKRRAITYDHWSREDMADFLTAWHPRVRGWVVLIIDHVEVRWAEEILGDFGRYVFAPLPFVETGRTVRLTGDGPSSWTSWIVVARPRSMCRWGTLPGAYITMGGQRGERHIGGKPIDLMRALVKDYSRPSDLIADPCAGYGTTGLAALSMGRRFVGAECDEAAHAEAMKRLSRPTNGDLLAGLG
jgi:hypothetical protein